VGVATVKELLAQGFTVTALTRASSKATFPQGVRVQKVEDYSSAASLESALRGQDAVVSVIATAAVAEQIALVDAAVAAGVKRFLPSEFGVNTRTLDSEDAITSILGTKTRVNDHLVQKSSESENFSWTSVVTGSFFDWVSFASSPWSAFGVLQDSLGDYRRANRSILLQSLDMGTYGLNKATKTATIYDSGDARIHVSNVPFIAKAVAVVLRRPQETKNRYVAIASGYTSQNKLLQRAEKTTGQTWTVERVATADMHKAGREAVGRGDYGAAFVPLLLSHLFSDDGGLHVTTENDNELLGLSEEDLNATLDEWLVAEKGNV
jgi:putative NADH-flavin reductase